MASASSSAASQGSSGSIPLVEDEKLLREAIMFTLRKGEFLAETSRAKSVQSVGKSLLSLSGSNEMMFKKFSQELVKLLKMFYEYWSV